MLRALRSKKVPATRAVAKTTSKIPHARVRARFQRFTCPEACTYRTSWQLAAGAILFSIVFSKLTLAQSNSPQSFKPYSPDTPGNSHASMDLRVPEIQADQWLFPITKIDEGLPPWLQFGGQFRNRVESRDGLNYKPVNDVYNLTQLRLGAYLQLTKWIELVGVTQDSRVFFNHHVTNTPPYQNIWDVREAYLELGSPSEGRFDLVAGRQILSFGDERVIGPSDWLNMGRTFDAVKVDFHPRNVKVSLFASSVIVARDGAVDHHIQGNNLYGLYTSFSHLLPHMTLEPYLLWRIAPADVKLSEDAGRGHLNEVTGGARLAGTLRQSFDFDIEMNKKTGSLGHYTVDAWAGHWNLGYTARDARSKPRVFTEYNYASGNKNPNGSTWGTHDQIYPSSHDKMEFADEFGWRNIHDFRIGVSEKLGKKWQLTEDVNNLWLATRNDAVYNSAGSPAVPAHPAATSSHLGTELNMIAVYQQNSHVSYGFGFAHLFTGQFLKQATPGKSFNYPYAYMTYIF